MPKLVPRCLQYGTNMAPKRRTRVPIGPQHAPPKGPSWPRFAPRWFEMAPGARGHFQDEPGWPDGGPQEAPRRPKMATRRPKKAPIWPPKGPRRPQDGTKRG